MGADLNAALAGHGLALLGLAPPDGHVPPDTRAIALIGPRGGAAWWDIVTASPEWRDGAADPLDRWSRRVLSAVATAFDATPLFPFGGPPWLPFQTWAKASGRAWESPVRLLVHAEAGLWVSFRGALALPFAPDLPPTANPCESCAEKPCLTACPPRALTGAGYDVPACHAFLDTEPGRACLARGCRVRAACPVSVRHARLAVQSAYHMSRFHT